MPLNASKPQGVRKSSSTLVRSHTATIKTKGAARKAAMAPDALASNAFAKLESTRATDTHVFFWGGILSNWWKKSPNLSGAKCMDLVLADLDNRTKKIPHPANNAFSTQLIRNHDFNCGEQFMMAMKAWFFEQHLDLGEVKVDLSIDKSVNGTMGKIEFEELKSALLRRKANKSWAGDSNENLFHEGALCAILRSTEPRKQKALGKQAQGFNPEVWEVVGETVVTAGCVVRAEVDSELRELYIAAGSRKFVEGSPFDKIWGVGLRWDDPSIDYEKNWNGQNKLGKCHDAATVEIRKRSADVTI